jgi:arginase family enzyme
VSAPWSAIGVPIDSVGRAGGTEHAPAAVREHDLLARIGAEDRGDLDVRIHGEERDPATGVIAIADTLATTRAVRAAVRDVLDERAMPATDCLMPEGLEWDELAALMAPLGASPGLAGLSLGCLNPEKDPGGTYTERTCALPAGALAAR